MSEEYDTDFEDENMLERRLSTTDNSIQENEETITLVWFNPGVNTTDDTEKIKEALRVVNDVVLFPDDIDSCITDIKSRKTEKIFLITSANNALKLPSNIIDLSQLDLMFIYPENREESNHLRDEYPKVVEIFDNANDLLKSIKKSIRHSSRQLKILSFYDQHQQGTRDLSQEEAEFLWFQSFKVVIRDLPDSDKANAKEEMLTACRQYYRNNEQKLKSINDFDQNYHSNECIRWYTMDTFIYQLINKALRTEDIVQLYIFRYFIADLSKQLAQKYAVMKNDDEKKNIVLYRGTLFNKTEIEKLKAIVGKLIAGNSYWSTSRDRSCALTFANKFNDRPDIVPVLFEIECDLHDQNNSIIFADISSLSEFQTEEEFLFDAGSVFQIGEIREGEQDNTKLYVVQIRTSGKGREIVEEYIEEIQREMEYESPRIMLGILLKRIGKYKKSLNYYEELLENPGEEKRSHIHNRIGIALKSENKYDLALKQFDRAYDLTKFDSSERIYLAFIRHNQGQIYAKKRKFPQAISYYKDAINIVKKELNNANRYIADYYSSIGRVRLYQRYYKEALNYQQKALKIRKSCFRPNHVIHAFSYIEIAKIHSFSGKYQKALQYHVKALKLRQKYLLPDHLNTASSLYFVGKMHYEMADLKTARDYYTKSLDMTRKCIPSSQHYNILSILQDIALTYHYNSQEALNYRLEALDIQNNTEPVHYPRLARLVDEIAFTYKSMSKMKDSLAFYEQALKIREAKLPEYAFSLSYSFNNLASLNEKMGDMVSALTYYDKALTIYEYYYSYYHWLCEKTRKNIQRIERML